MWSHSDLKACHGKVECLHVGACLNGVSQPRLSQVFKVSYGAIPEANLCPHDSSRCCACSFC